MLNKIITKLVILALKSKKITGQNKASVLNALMENIGMLPTQKIITFDQYGTLLLKGKPLVVEQALTFKQGAMALKDNEVRKVLNEYKKWLAVEMGVHQGLNPEMILFSKACLYLIQEEEKMLEQIIQE